jgi:hypothetical protein
MMIKIPPAMVPTMEAFGDPLVSGRLLPMDSLVVPLSRVEQVLGARRWRYGSNVTL